ncbi:MAG: transglycosylase SLT domain-containing protein [Sandaracinus sp.]|nr:transglycosylase SLT domain-containing protein [Sandaracinus sp.]
MRNVIAIALVLGGWSPLLAQSSDDATPPPTSGVVDDTSATAEDDADLDRRAGPTALALARALDARLTVWRNGSRQVYVRHCRSARVSCRARVVALARVLARAGVRHGVDPFLLAAMALRESGLNPFAEGAAGERGIVQLHPRGVGSHVRFVRSEGYRQRCSRAADACQEEVVEAGARLVAASMARCGGMREALGAYNSGVCQATSYGDRVLEERASLVAMAKQGLSAREARLVD